MHELERTHDRAYREQHPLGYPRRVEETTVPRLRGDAGSGKGYVAWVIGLLVLSVVATFAIVGTGWWFQDAPLNTFRPEGVNAQTIQDLVTPVFIVAGVIFVLVEGGILWMAFRNRRDEDDDELPTQTHGNVKLEIGWTILPAAIMAFIAVGTVVTILELNDYDDTEMVVEVWGQQWWWQFAYDNDGDGVFGETNGDDIVTASEMVIPADTNVEVRVGSNDVIHSFWIPNLNGKRDAVPLVDEEGNPRTSAPWKIQADEPGRYRGQCTEYCGLSHARMQMYVVALPPDQYEEWVESQLEPAAELTRDDFDSDAELASWERGRELMGDRCTSCHTVRGVGEPEEEVPLQAGVAPDLTHFASRDHFAGAILNTWEGVEDTLDEDTPVTEYLTKRYADGEAVPATTNLEDWLRDPEGVKPMDPNNGQGMPNYNLSESEIDDLVTYLTRLK